MFVLSYSDWGSFDEIKSSVNNNLYAFSAYWISVICSVILVKLLIAIFYLRIPYIFNYILNKTYNWKLLKLFSYWPYFCNFLLVVIYMPLL